MATKKPVLDDKISADELKQRFPATDEDIKQGQDILATAARSFAMAVSSETPATSPSVKPVVRQPERPKVVGGTPDIVVDKTEVGTEFRQKLNLDPPYSPPVCPTHKKGEPFCFCLRDSRVPKGQFVESEGLLSA